MAFGQPEGSEAEGMEGHNGRKSVTKAVISAVITDTLLAEEWKPPILEK